MEKQPAVCVVGSINIDMVTTAKEFPEQGETVLGGEFKTYHGGKGANQAIAAARLGAEVTMIGAVGDDQFGKDILQNFRAEGVHEEAISVIPKTSTGIATIILSEGDNRIIVSPGANSKLTPEIIATSREILMKSDIILLQLEIPMETVRYTVDFAYEHHIPVVINPAPFQKIPEDILKKVTYLTPNELEHASLAELPFYRSMKDKAIITKGGDGVEYETSTGKKIEIPSYQVNVKDTTGAGDTFNGALVTEIASGSSIEQAIKFANAAAALSVERVGAQGGMPTREEVLGFINKQESVS